MGVATVPNLSELEAEIERRELHEQYARELADLVNSGAMLFYSTIELDDWKGDAYKFVIALTRLTETQKTQAALKVLNGN